MSPIMPIEQAVIKCLMGSCFSFLAYCNFCMACTRATMAPLIAVVRVPPSAWSTSQSTTRVRSPSVRKSIQLRKALPMSLWISIVRPVCLPRADSRSQREWVARGSMPYSAVSQPRFWSFKNLGTPSVTLTVHRTRVSPQQASTEPSACLVKLL